MNFGIICEFNPFHAGHAYLFEQARRLGAKSITCVMSGNSVQRGELAIFDKYSRAEMAMDGGADLVLELPFPWCSASAEYFAAAGIRILAPICDAVIFGSECGDIDTLINTEPDSEFKDSMKSGISYGKALSAFENEPNNLLGKEYIKAIDLLDSQIIPVTLKRDQSLRSASKIRDDLKRGVFCNDMHSIKLPPVFFDKFFDIIKYKIIASNVEQLQKICGISEGLEHKIKKEILFSTSIEELIFNIKSKRYTYSRISRILCCILLDITKAKLRTLINEAPKVKLLAINKERAQILSLLNNYYISPLDAEKQTISTKLSSETNVLSTKIYSIYSDLIGDEDYTLGLIKI